MIRVSHKRVECIGCSVCAEIAPDYYHMADDGLASLNKLSHQHSSLDFAEVFDMDKDKLVECQDNCPVNIIKVLH